MIQDQVHVKTVKKYNYDDEGCPLISKQKKKIWWISRQKAW